MPATALTTTALGHNKAWRTTTGTAADTTNYNSAPNTGQTIVIITTGATPGTVSISFARSIDGSTPADITILDDAGGALAANTTYVLGLGAPTDYGNPTTIKASQATTKLTVLNIAP